MNPDSFDFSISLNAFSRCIVENIQCGESLVDPTLQLSLADCNPPTKTISQCKKMYSSQWEL